MESPANAVILFGGRSDERLVSVASAQNLVQQFQFSELWFIHPEGPISRVDADELLNHQRAFEVQFRPKQKAFINSINESIPHLKGKSVFMGLHGTEGEDGTIQSLFESAKIPFTGSGSKSSRVCFEKHLAKEAVTKDRLPLAPQALLDKSSGKEELKDKLGKFQKDHGRIVIKPVASGSSIGLLFFDPSQNLNEVVEQIWTSSYTVYIAEKFIQGRELTVGVIDRQGKLQPLCASEVILDRGASFDYQGKYLGRGTTEITPAELSPKDMEIAQALAIAAHKSLGCYGYSRTDMILTDTGAVFLETNTLPGMTKASFIPQQLKVANISVADFVAEQLRLAQARY